MGLEFPPYPAVPASHIPGSRGGKGSVQGSEPSPYHRTQPSRLVSHPPAPLLTVNQPLAFSHSHPFPPAPLPVSLLCSEPRCGHEQPPKSPRCDLERPESFCVCKKTKVSPRNSKAGKGDDSKGAVSKIFQRKISTGLPLAKQKCPLRPSLHSSCWGRYSAGAKELLQEEEADPGHLDKSLQGSRPARLLPRDKREAALLRGTDTGLISSRAGAVTVSREAKTGEGRREGGRRRRWGCQHPKMFQGNQPRAAA